MSEEIDFEQLVALLDRALTSKDPKVRKALKKFLFIAALATEEDDDAEIGPFKNLFDTIEDLKQRLATLENQNGLKYPNTWISPKVASPWYYYGGGATSVASGSTTKVLHGGGSYSSSVTPKGNSTITYTTPATFGNLDSYSNYSMASFDNPSAIDDALEELDDIAKDQL